MNSTANQLESKIKDLINEFADLGTKYSTIKKSGMTTFAVTFVDGEEISKLEKKCATWFKARGVVNLLGMKFFSSTSGKQYQIIDVNTRARSYPIIALCSDTGKKYKLSFKSVLDAMGGAKQINRASNLESILDLAED